MTFPALPDSWIARIFGTLRATYGAAFDRMWTPPAGLPPEQVAGYAQALSAHWSRELAGFAAAPNAIVYALDNLPEQPPNLVQFKALCSRRPEVAPPSLPAPRASKSLVDAELARALAGIGSRGPLQWAYDLQEREAAGGEVSGYARRCWREALASRSVDTSALHSTFVPLSPDCLPPGMRPQPDPEAEYAAGGAL